MTKVTADVVIFYSGHVISYGWHIGDEIICYQLA